MEQRYAKSLADAKEQLNNLLSFYQEAPRTQHSFRELFIPLINRDETRQGNDVPSLSRWLCELPSRRLAGIRSMYLAERSSRVLSFDAQRLQIAEHQTLRRIELTNANHSRIKALQAQHHGATLTFLRSIDCTEPPLSRTKEGLLAQDPNASPEMLRPLSQLYPEELQSNPALPLLLLEDPNVLEWTSPRHSLTAWLGGCTPDERRQFWQPLVLSTFCFSSALQKMASRWESLGSVLELKKPPSSVRLSFESFFSRQFRRLRDDPDTSKSRREELERLFQDAMMVVLGCICDGSGGRYLENWFPSAVFFAAERELTPPDEPPSQKTTEQYELRKEQALEVTEIAEKSWWRAARRQRDLAVS